MEEVRRETFTEVMIDRKISSKNKEELVGRVTAFPNPEDSSKDMWMVVGLQKGTYYTFEDEEKARIMASLEEVKHMLIRLLQKEEQ